MSGDKTVYIVNGVFSSMSEMFTLQHPPFFKLEITLLPYKKEIIIGDWPKFLPTYYDSGIFQFYKSIYQNAKASGTLVTSL